MPPATKSFSRASSESVREVSPPVGTLRPVSLAPSQSMVSLVETVVHSETSDSNGSPSKGDDEELFNSDTEPDTAVHESYDSRVPSLSTSVATFATSGSLGPIDLPSVDLQLPDPLSEAWMMPGFTYFPSGTPADPMGSIDFTAPADVNQVAPGELLNFDFADLSFVNGDPMASPMTNTFFGNVIAETASLSKGWPLLDNTFPPRSVLWI